MVCYCFNIQKINKPDSKTETERQLFKRFVDVVISSVSGESENLLRKINTRRRKLESNKERTDENGNLDFLEMNVKVTSSKEINCELYKRPTDTRVVINFRSYASMQHKKNIVGGTLHRVLENSEEKKRKN